MGLRENAHPQYRPARPPPDGCSHWPRRSSPCSVLPASGPASTSTSRSTRVKYRTHSLFHQGSYWYGRIATMREAWLVSLMNAFAEILAEQTEMTDILGVI
jgi:hypothetical protein